MATTVFQNPEHLNAAHGFCAGLCLVAALAATSADAADYARSYLVDGVLMPTTIAEARSYAIDVDGDSHADNGFGQLVAELTTQGMDFNGSMAAAVASGSVAHRVHLQSTDASLANDPAAQATWCISLPTETPPLFDGTDNPSCADTSGIFVAALSGGTFTSAPPATTVNPLNVDIKFALGTSHFTMAVMNARISFTIGVLGEIQAGQINGSIPHSDIENQFEPAMGVWCNGSIQSDPSSSTAVGCLALFDNGCAGFPELAGDGQIAICEIQENVLMQSLFAPDVQVSNGSAIVNANSIGLRFTAIAIDRLFADGFQP